ncbi:MAG: 50S ribosomal protein L3 [Vicinamibacteria bacterium]|jgi:large subunit ribosomal protein L3|nr:50S ribosomal protein L3 [Vicinamibacteria bacterium]
MSIQGIIGRKVGMTQVFLPDGKAVPVTVVEAGPCVVIQRKTAGKDGYDAAQIGLVEARKSRGVTKPMAGHFAKAGVPPCRVLREVPVAAGSEAKVGDRIAVDAFAEGEKVTIIGVTKGKGFQGVVKRHHFRGGAATHGSMFHRAPGSIGQSAFPSRVLKGMRAAGHMGADRITVKNVHVVRVEAEKNVLLIRGAVPGANGDLIVIRKAAR